ncbi:hypothetical protein Mgra_00003677 [Meloidogyne graminicola]|uniref:Uncharacterized protein n=1 Tax=Meloidogyne graminicola TaxID=189291 RepID=A0A8S9ZUR9_9BILA|nr:hypothetical protein Mgra_00003677 [Meloidogyne graminicola]
MAGLGGNCSKFIGGAFVEAGKETLKIGEKILDQVQSEVTHLALFQGEHEECLSNLVMSAKVMVGSQQTLTSTVLTNQWLILQKNKLRKMQEEFDSGENEYFSIQEEISALKEELRLKINQKSTKITTPKPSTPKIPKLKLKTSILKPITPKRKGKRLPPSPLPPPKKIPFMDKNKIFYI